MPQHRPGGGGRQFTTFYSQQPLFLKFINRELLNFGGAPPTTTFKEQVKFDLGKLIELNLKLKFSVLRYPTPTTNFKFERKCIDHIFVVFFFLLHIFLHFKYHWINLKHWSLLRIQLFYIKFCLVGSF